MRVTDLRPSLNEIEQLTAKAARGAGNGWGIAEDIARATRWRADRGLGWSPALLRLLGAGPVADRFGAVFMVADLLAAAHPGDRWTLEGCEPGWVLPLLSAALPRRDLGLDLAWTARRVRLAPDGASADTALADHALDTVQEISVVAARAMEALPHPLRPRRPSRPGSGR